MKNRNLVALLLALLAAVVLPACGGGGGGSTGGGGTATYSISGTITLSGAGLSGVTVSLNSVATTTTDGSGNYSISGLANGVYTITPARTGYTFNPVNRVITVNGANTASVNFTATAAATTYSLVGRVTVTVTGTGLQGATITLNTLATTNTNTAGDYTFTGLSNGTYTVTPSHANYTFTPISKSQSISGSGATGVNFIATPIPDPTRAIVKFSTSATTTNICGVDIMIALPTGASVKTAGSTSMVDEGSAFPSGNAKNEILVATYSAPSGTVHGLVISAGGFSSGEFLTLVADLTPPMTPTAADFVVQFIYASNCNGDQIPGVTASASSALQGGGTPTKGRLKLVTSGTTTTVTGIDVTIKLPAGVSVSSAAAPPATDPGVVFSSGNAVSNSFTAGNYDTINRTLHIGLINMYGFNAGEFATVMCDLAPGVTPTAPEFVIQSATVYGLYSSTSITGASVDRTVTLE